MTKIQLFLITVSTDVHPKTVCSERSVDLCYPGSKLSLYIANHKKLLGKYVFSHPGTHTNAGPPKKRHKGWSPESSANSLQENTVKTSPSSSALSTLSVYSVATNGARIGTNGREIMKEETFNGVYLMLTCIEETAVCCWVCLHVCVFK